MADLAGFINALSGPRAPCRPVVWRGSGCAARYEGAQLLRTLTLAEPGSVCAARRIARREGGARGVDRRCRADDDGPEGR